MVEQIRALSVQRIRSRFKTARLSVDEAGEVAEVMRRWFAS